MSVPPTATQPAASVAQPCGACGAPLAHDQRYCLQCGEVRRGARRELPALLRDALRGRQAGVVAGATAGAERWPSLAAALAGLACLLLAMGVGVLIGRGGGESAPAPAAITIAGGPAAAATPVATAFTSDWPDGEQGWTIALDVLAKASTEPGAVAAAKAAATGKGAPAVGALDADEYASLTAGSYVVYSGVFDSDAAARKALSPLKASFPEARVVRVGESDSSSPGSSTGGSNSASAPKKRESAGGAQDTKDAFEKSKKAPKTVGTGGKPPPKDNKPAAGGGGFEEIE